MTASMLALIEGTSSGLGRLDVSNEEFGRNSFAEILLTKDLLVAYSSGVFTAVRSPCLKIVSAAGLGMFPSASAPSDTTLSVLSVFNVIMPPDMVYCGSQRRVLDNPENPTKSAGT